ncbi:MAG: hypothetical protein U0T77_08480 [Chitinophagales bacterium]
MYRALDTVEINNAGCDGLYNGQTGHSILKQLNLATVNISNPSTTAIVLNDYVLPAANDVSKSLFLPVVQLSPVRKIRYQVLLSLISG